MNKIISFKDLKVWEEAHQLVLNIYRITSEFPKEEIYGLTSQIRRASSSIPANIAEGFGRYSTKEYIQFLTIARGSLEEVNYFLFLSKDLQYITENNYLSFSESVDNIRKMLNGLIKSLRNKPTDSNLKPLTPNH
jgi:four helix bundle protein